MRKKPTIWVRLWGVIGSTAAVAAVTGVYGVVTSWEKSSSAGSGSSSPAGSYQTCSSVAIEMPDGVIKVGIPT